ncbi:Zinc/cadmium/mercury/lead-transporting ATPase, partial [Dysosmobacter welbionis]
LLVVAVHELPCGVAGTADTMFCQLALGRRIDWISKLLPAGRRGGDLELTLQTGFPHKVFHDILGHWAPTDIAV